MISIWQEGGHPQHRSEKGREQQGEIVEGQRQCGGTAQANHLHILSGQKKTEIETPWCSAWYRSSSPSVMQTHNKCYEWCHVMSQLLFPLWDQHLRCDYILSWWCVISAGRLDTIWWCHVLHVITIMDSCLYSWGTIRKYIYVCRQGVFCDLSCDFMSLKLWFSVTRQASTVWRSTFLL